MRRMRLSKPRARNSRNWRRRDGGVQDERRRATGRRLICTDINPGDMHRLRTLLQSVPARRHGALWRRRRGTIFGIVTDDDDDDDFDGELNRKIMKVDPRQDCIGCSRRARRFVRRTARRTFLSINWAADPMAFLSEDRRSESGRPSAEPRPDGHLRALAVASERFRTRRPLHGPRLLLCARARLERSRRALGGARPLARARTSGLYG